jgi:uncharacterized lipoprotein YddW (UPF0748 family)
MKLLLTIIWSLCLCALSLAQTARASEVRALWVVRTTLTSPEKIRQLVSSAADNQFNTLIVQIRGHGDAYYKSLVRLYRAPERVEPGRSVFGARSTRSFLKPVSCHKLTVMQE